MVRSLNFWMLQIGQRSENVAAICLWYFFASLQKEFKPKFLDLRNRLEAFRDRLSAEPVQQSDSKRDSNLEVLQ